MDAYLLCPETKNAMWLGKPIREETDNNNERVLYYHRGPYNGPLNHQNEELNMILWKFLAEHTKKDMRIMFDHEFNEGEYRYIGSDEVETAEYLRGWPPK